MMVADSAIAVMPAMESSTRSSTSRNRARFPDPKRCVTDGTKAELICPININTVSWARTVRLYTAALVGPKIEPTKNTFACACIFMARADMKKRLDSPMRLRTDSHRNDTATLRTREHRYHTPTGAAIEMIRERVKMPEAIAYRPLP